MNTIEQDDEEEVPHRFTPRMGSDVDEEGPIWCADPPLPRQRTRKNRRRRRAWTSVSLRPTHMQDLPRPATR